MSTAIARALALACGGAWLAVAAVGAEEPAPYSPHLERAGAQRVFWGDLHVHTRRSQDAYSFGNERLSPDDAFRFAAGEEVTSQTGQRVKLQRPLDFLLVSDHSEYMALFPKLVARDPVLMESETGRRWVEDYAAGKQQEVVFEITSAMFRSRDVLENEAYDRAAWREVVENAERHNRPGQFTAFIGYEWTSMPNGANLHRNVVYRDGAERAGQRPPFSSLDSTHPEDLWRFMSDYEADTGGRILAIPHNSNLSAGLMFAVEDSKGEPLSREYAEMRSRFEPLVEATQIKGDSETAPFLSPDDEFADFGTWDDRGGVIEGPHEDWMYRGEYVRPALGVGLDVAARVGANPFQFGLIGSTDSHTALATADDDNFFGKWVSDEPHAGRVEEDMGNSKAVQDALGNSGRTRPKSSYLASGYAAVWADQNTREDLFDAMARRETYATTGPRMTVRFFGGGDFREEDALVPDLARLGYARGVPMGGELARGIEQATFLVAALRDPVGANLDRIQIIKGWRDAEGELHERVHDVAVSGGRKIRGDGRARKPVGSTVDVETATYRNAIGAAQLLGFWRDPDFDPAEPAFYYVRVLEIPTPRWSTYDAVRFGTEPMEGVPSEVQQRAYTSPIWYQPADD